MDRLLDIKGFDVASQSPKRKQSSSKSNGIAGAWVSVPKQMVYTRNPMCRDSLQHVILQETLPQNNGIFPSPCRKRYRQHVHVEKKFQTSSRASYGSFGNSESGDSRKVWVISKRIAVMVMFR